MGPVLLLIAGGAVDGWVRDSLNLQIHSKLRAMMNHMIDPFLVPLSDDRGVAAMIAKFLAGQLGRPSGFFGRHLILRLLNRVNQQDNALALDALRLTREDIVLEIGFGGGGLLGDMARFVDQGHVSGVDLSSDVVKAGLARFAKQVKAGRVDLTCADVRQLPFGPATFTRVCTVNTVYFWPEPLRALAEIRRVLRVNGILVVCFTPKADMKNRGFTRYGFTLYEPEEVLYLLTSAGFRNVTMTARMGRHGACNAAAATK